MPVRDLDGQRTRSRYNLEAACEAAGFRPRVAIKAVGAAIAVAPCRQNRGVAVLMDFMCRQGYAPTPRERRLMDFVQNRGGTCPPGGG